MSCYSKHKPKLELYTGQRQSINVYLYINVFYVMYLHIVLSDICRHIVTVLVTGHRQRGDWEAPGLHHAESKYKVQCDCPNI